MSESKTYVFGQDAGNNMLGILAPILQRQGLDPNMVMAMMNNRNDFGGQGAWFIWILFLLILCNRNGFGGNGDAGGTAYLGNLINNDAGRELLMQAIQSNGSRLGELASQLNCSTSTIQNAFYQLQTAICGVSNQIGTSSLQTINALQAGNANIASQLAKCCCDNQLAICQQTNTLQQNINNVATGQERGFSSLAYETQRQTCDIRDAIRENTAQVINGQRAAEMRELNRDIAERDRKIAEQAVVINNGQQTAIFGQMIQQATAPIMAAVNGLQTDVNGLKCKLPETATVPYSPIVGVPSCVAAQYGLGFGLNPFGIWG